MYYCINVKIIENKQVNKNFYKLSFKSNISKEFSPGQFLTIDCGMSLRRPFCIFNVEENIIEILYKVVGEGTKFLSRKNKGDIINIFGPLGTGYNINEKHSKLLNVLIGGGTGIAGLYFLAKELNRKYNASGIIFYGTKKNDEIINISFLKNYGWEIKISTEDGSKGYRGKITEIFKNWLIKNNKSNIYVYAAGPNTMLKKIIEISKKNKIQLQVSLQQIITCGIGACRGCVIDTINGYKTVCHDGPVFNGYDLIL